MKTLTYHAFGEPQDVLAVHDAPTPEPAAGQVRIRTTLSAIHNHDLWTVRGTYGYRPTLPAIGGTEAVGVIDAVGEGVDAALIGRRVTTAAGRGTWAEAFLAPASAVIPLPDAITDEAGAQLMAMPFSALALLETLNVQPGDWIIQNAANGAVGRTLALLGRARGVNVINLVRRQDGVTDLAAQGIEHTFATDTDHWKDDVRALVGDAPIRAAVDSIGGSASGDLAQLLGMDGTLVSFGSMKGEAMQISSGDVIFKHLTVKGFWGSRIIGDMTPEERARLTRELVTLVASGDLPLPVGGTYALADIRDAVTASLTPGKTGKILLKP